MLRDFLQMANYCTRLSQYIFFLLSKLSYVIRIQLNAITISFTFTSDATLRFSL